MATIDASKRIIFVPEIGLRRDLLREVLRERKRAGRAMRLPGRAHRRRSLRSLVGQVLLRKSAQDGRLGHHGERCCAKHVRGTQAVGQSRQTPPSGSRDTGLGLRISCGMLSPLYFGKISSLHNNTHFLYHKLSMWVE